MASWFPNCLPKFYSPHDVLNTSSVTGGLMLVNLKELNKAAILNMCWGTKQKQDRLWMKLIHNYYIRRQSMNELRVPTQTCWMVRKVLGAKDSLHLLHNASGGKRSKTRLAYNQMLRNYPKVYCRGLICCNSARPKAIFKL